MPACKVAGPNNRRATRNGDRTDTNSHPPMNIRDPDRAPRKQRGAAAEVHTRDSQSQPPHAFRRTRNPLPKVPVPVTSISLFSLPPLAGNNASGLPIAKYLKICGAVRIGWPLFITTGAFWPDWVVA